MYSPITVTFTQVNADKNIVLFHNNGNLQEVNVLDVSEGEMKKKADSGIGS